MVTGYYGSASTQSVCDKMCIAHASLCSAIAIVIGVRRTVARGESTLIT